MLSSLTASASPAPAPVKAAAPVEAPKSHAYDPGDAPVKLKDAPPPLVLTTRENEASVLGLDDSDHTEHPRHHREGGEHHRQ